MTEEEVKEKLKEHRSTVRTLANRLARAAERGGLLGFDDLVSIGNVAVLEGVESFREQERGMHERTWVWIVVNSRMVDQVRKHDTLTRAEQNAIKRWQKTGRGDDPHVHALLRRKHVSIHGALLGDSRRHVPRPKMSDGRVSWHMTGDGALVLGDIIPDEQTPSPEEVLQEKELQEQIMSFIDRLPMREGIMLRLNLLHGMTRMATGDVMGLTEGRISQIYKSAIKHLVEDVAKAGI